MSHYIERKDNKQVYSIDFVNTDNVNFFKVCSIDDIYGDYVCLCKNNKDNQCMLSSKNYLCHYFIFKNNLLVYFPRVRIVNPKYSIENVKDYNEYFGKAVTYLGVFYEKSSSEDELITLYKTIEFLGDSFRVIKIDLKRFEDNKLCYPSVSCIVMSLWDLFKYPLNSYALQGESKYVVKYVDQHIFDINLKDTLNWFSL